MGNRMFQYALGYILSTSKQSPLFHHGLLNFNIEPNPGTPANNILETKKFGNNKIDFKAQNAQSWNGATLDLSKKEAMLLKLLIENKGEVVTREKILQVVWGYNVYPTTRTIDNFILNFRKYFEDDSRNPKYFHSVRGVGYKYTS